MDLLRRKNNRSLNLIFYFQIAVCFFFMHVYHAQSSNFTLQVTSVNETCPGNGRLNFTVSNTTPGGTIIFTVYKLPNIVTPIVVTQANTFTGLVAGNYRVIATQSLPNGTVTTQQVDTIIEDKITRLQLNFVVTDANCTVGGIITIRTITGQPQIYEIVTGPTGAVTQNSNVFSNLPSGNYTIKVTDICGDYIQQNVTVGFVIPTVVFSANPERIINCNTIEVSNTISTNFGILLYPLTVEYTIYDPSGVPTVTSSVISSGNSNTLVLTNPIPFYYGQNYRYTIKVTDRCGYVFQSNDFILNPVMEVFSEITVMNCTDKSIKITVNKFGVAPFQVNFTNAPAGFNPNIYNNLHPNYTASPILYFNSTTPLPAGNYDIVITDACGRTDATSITVSSVPIPLPTIIVSQLRGCAEGYTSVSIGANTLSYGIVSASLESAPVSYTSSLPMNLNTFLHNGTIYMANLTTGVYTFKVIDTCGNNREVIANVIGYHTVSNDFTVNRNCTSFSLDLRNQSNIPATIAEFWLQKWNSVSNQWVHPVTGVAVTNGISVTNALRIVNNAVTNIVNNTGTFRIVKTFSSYKTPTLTDASTLVKCIEVLGEFENYWEPKINSIYSFSCANNTYQVIVDVIGVAPFRYEIIEKDGNPFYIDNANSSVFNAIAPGTYKFRVTDICGNQKLRLFEVNGNVAMEITATPLCDGSNGALSVPYFPYLQYEWWKDNATTVILSTTNQLPFRTFQSVSDIGTYHVRISNPGNPNSCIDFVKEYTILASSSNPNAGDNSDVTFCDSKTNLNLDTLLSTPHDANGVWSEITNSGVPILNNYWNATNISNGIYQFKYTVTGFCGRYDEAMVSIRLSSSPPAPIASVDTNLCEGGSLQLFATTVPGAVYVWNGPNGFTSNLQNPILPNISNGINGVYTVSVIVVGCESLPSEVTVAVHPKPNFKMVEKCFQGTKYLSVVSNTTDIQNSYTNYTWTFPDGSQYEGNPLLISNGQTGLYTVAVTDMFGCATSGNIAVKCTSCGYIPRGVSANGDTVNDNFDLQCLENVTNVKIYNRYGMLLFEKDDYLNEWEGKDQKGNLLPVATYYYHITFASGETKTGWVYLNY